MGRIQSFVVRGVTSQTRTTHYGMRRLTPSDPMDSNCVFSSARSKAAAPLTDNERKLIVGMLFFLDKGDDNRAGNRIR